MDKGDWIPLEPPCGMSKGQKEIIDEENKYREMFYSDRENQILDDPHLNMINPFDPEIGKTFIFEEEGEEEKRVPKILTSQRRSEELNGKPSLVTDRTTFEANWAKFTGGILDGLNWNNVFVAGGSVLSCLTLYPLVEKSYAASDIDLFLYGLPDDASANAKLREIYNTLLANTRAATKKREEKAEEAKKKEAEASQQQQRFTWLKVLAERRAAERAAAAKKDDAEYGVLAGEDAELLAVRSKRAVSFVGGYPARNVQVILRVYKSPAEVLLGFDVDSCAVGYDGRSVWATPRFRNAQNKGYNLVNTTRRSSNYEVRLRKYARRGYAVAVPGLDKARADPALFTRNSARLLLQAQGLARLLVYEFYDIHREFRPRVTYSPTLHRMLCAAVSVGGGDGGEDRSAAAAAGTDHLYRSTSYYTRYGFDPDEYADRIAEYAAAEAENPSDYSDVFIPWGPLWSLRATRKMLNVRDKSNLFSSKYNKEDKEGGDNEENDDDDDDDENDNDNKIIHNHCFVTGIDGVIEGKPNAYWCRLCKEHVPLEKCEGNEHIYGPIQWERGCPCYQDYEHGVLRKLIVGSFSTLTEPYDKGAYTDVPFPADRPHPLQRQKPRQQKRLLGKTFNK